MSYVGGGEETNRDDMAQKGEGKNFGGGEQKTRTDKEEVHRRSRRISGGHDVGSKGEEGELGNV